jgi:hypothetical protein
LTKVDGLVNVTVKGLAREIIFNMGIQRGKKRAIVVKANLTDRDPWLARILDTLKRGGYEVTLLGWDREGRFFGTRRNRTESGHNEILLTLGREDNPVLSHLVVFRLLLAPESALGYRAGD